MTSLAVTLPDELLEDIAERAARLIVGRETAKPTGYLDVPKAAEFLACPPSRIYALVSAGRLPVERDGSRLLFGLDELRAYVKAGGAKRP